MRPGANVLKLSEEFRLAEHLILKRRISNNEGLVSDIHTPNQQVAILYGKTAFLSPEKKAQLVKEKLFEVAFADFLNAQYFDVVDLSAFSGKPGSQMFISLVPEYLPSTVLVKIETSDGLIVYEESASRGLFPSEWTLYLNQNPSGLMGDKITITATSQ